MPLTTLSWTCSASPCRKPAEPRSAPAALRPRLLDLAARLGRVEQFYDSVGGVLGYQLKSLELIVAGMQVGHAGGGMSLWVQGGGRCIAAVLQEGMQVGVDAC